MNEAKINLGSGPDYRDGWHNVDVKESVRPDEIADLDDIPWPWEDNQFEEVLMDNVIEHLDDQLAVLEELHRITSPGGKITVAFPHPSGRSQWIDPTHKHTIHPETFEHALSPEWDIVDVSVSRVRFGRAIPEQWALWWSDHLGFLVDEVRVTLRVGIEPSL